MGTDWLRVKAKRFKTLPSIDISLDFSIYLTIYKEFIIQVDNGIEMFIMKDSNWNIKEKTVWKENTKDERDIYKHCFNLKDI